MYQERKTASVVRNTIDVPLERTDNVKARLQLAIALPGVFFIAVTLLGLSFTFLARDLRFLIAGIVVGLFVGAVVMLTIGIHDSLNALERWTGRDLNGDGSIGAIIDEAHQLDLATRSGHALRFICEQGGSWTRRKLVDELGLFSQGEWAEFYKALIERGITDPAGKRLLVVSYRHALELWNAGGPRSYRVMPDGNLVRR